MKISKSQGMKKRRNRVKRTTWLVLALVCLTSALALPAYCRTRYASYQSTTEPTANSGWTLTGNLNTTHYLHTATLLPSGKVLAAGGGTARAELYDPVTRTWNETGSLNTTRMDHTAMLLQNGQVLIVGGRADYYDSNNLRSAELYDPATEQWRPTSSLNTIRVLSSSTLLPNGKVLALGGSNKKTPVLDTAELYDPATGTWSSTSAPSAWARTVLLPNGKVLAVLRNSAELYDPDTELWSKTGSLNRVAFPVTVTLLRNGKVLVTGWSGSGSYPVFYPVDAELYDPAAGTWSITGNLNAARRGGNLATLLADGRVLMAGGYASYEEVFDPATERWSFTGRLNALRDYHTATLLEDGQVLIAGGVDGLDSYDYQPTFLTGAELYDPATGPIPIAIPKIISASVAGKNVIVLGENFDPGAVILLNGEQQTTKLDAQNSQTALIGKKAAKKIKPGDKLQVRNANGTVSQEFAFAGS